MLLPDTPPRVTWPPAPVVVRFTLPLVFSVVPDAMLRLPPEVIRAMLPPELAAIEAPEFMLNPP